MVSSRDADSKWRVEDARPEHEPQICELFKAIFKQEMTPAHFHWKYGEGRGSGVVVLEGETVVAYFGGMDRRILFKGEAVSALQCGDSMVSEQHRGTLSKKGPFYLSVTSYLDKYLGNGRQYLVSYGFPNERAMRLAERLKMYVQVGTMVDIAWDPLGSMDFTAQCFDFDAAQHREVHEKCWRAMAADFSTRAIGVRDLAYLRHRYHAHPTLRYNIDLVLRASDQLPLGLLVTRQVGDRLMLVDVVAASHDIRNIVAYGRQLALTLNCRELYGWLTEIDCPLVAGSDERISSPPLRLPLGVYREGLNPDDIRDRWFFMCGDSDFQ